MFESTDLKRTHDLNRKILEKYSDAASDADMERAASFREFAQFIIHGENDFEGQNDILREGELACIVHATRMIALPHTKNAIALS